ncbi:MAG TPA: DUF3126 domain-containing protein [Alphaproteobacteria bacterium]|nr:DUF3126 domain-containing protein [Alphaproteobacteria bacterium]HAM49069.1 DUF3126 domain-containing protein [Alphaproteobacteria bacterium]HBA43083.1 DUF3126 domain-containing protein [Alphaproteobacteria bacterium]HBC54073.1 DUF3126 domain-containing protein [Alphaproteobacteria bacterium]HBF98446.1 DUF3126 domain-containing protein [Alphaproteobacteria bacterium]
MKKSEIQAVEKYLHKKLGNQQIRLDPETVTVDSVEVFIGDEFIAVVSRDTEDGELSYNFHMAILEEDLDELED